MDEELERSYNTTAGGINNRSSILQIRLDASGVLENIELYLSSTMVKIVRDDQTGETFQQRVKFGNPKANEEGIQSILSIISSILNAQIVQGNFLSYEDYENYIIELNIDLATDFMTNLENWEISEDNYNVILNHIMLMLIPFLTRLIKNKERGSYGETIKTVESATIREQSNKGGFKLFGGKGE